MKILYDHQIFTIQKFGGISRYFAQIISHLPDDIDYEIAIKYSDNGYLDKIIFSESIESMFSEEEKFFKNIKFRGRTRLFSIIKKINKASVCDCHTLNKKQSIEALKKQDFDIFHPTYYDDYFLDYLGNKPFVLTIHDMIHEIYPELFNERETQKKKALLAKKAAHIIAVSEKTKKDIRDILEVSEDKISVIYHANSLKKEKIREILPGNYLLFVGNRGLYKNFMFFVSAIEQILKRDPSLLVICIGSTFSAEERDFFNYLGVENRFISRTTSDFELSQLYQGAKALIFPSYYEGFGIPILEAFEAGCPVLLSSSSCFTEIAQDAALYFEPKNIKEMRSAIEDILVDNPLREGLIERGLYRVRDFSWSKSAIDTSNVYKRLLQNF